MHGITHNMTFKATTLILAIALLVPTAVKFSHIFSHHYHEVCDGENQTHLHKSDIDCDFYKFKLSSSFTLPSIDFEFVSAEDNHSINVTSYAFLSEFQRLHFSLRGPPQINLG
jgi:hypothetical protein